MNVARNFLLVAVAYLVIGLLIGMYMGGSGNRDLAPSHAHINLTGFVLMAIFAAFYKLYPEMAASALATVHFWVYNAGALVMNVGLFLMLAGVAAPETVGPAMPVGEAGIVIGVLVFGFNALKNAR